MQGIDRRQTPMTTGPLLPRLGTGFLRTRGELTTTQIRHLASVPIPRRRWWLALGPTYSSWSSLAL